MLIPHFYLAYKNEWHPLNQGWQELVVSHSLLYNVKYRCSVNEISTYVISVLARRGHNLHGKSNLGRLCKVKI